MTQYIIRRVIQMVPVLFFISVIVYGLIIISPVDPMSIYEDNPNITAEDMAMLEYRLGLQQPAFLNFPQCRSGKIGAERHPVRQLVARQALLAECDQVGGNRFHTAAADDKGVPHLSPGVRIFYRSY